MAVVLHMPDQGGSTGSRPGTSPEYCFSRPNSSSGVQRPTDAATGAMLTRKGSKTDFQRLGAQMIPAPAVGLTGCENMGSLPSVEGLTSAQSLMTKGGVANTKVSGLPPAPTLSAGRSISKTKALPAVGSNNMGQHLSSGVGGHEMTRQTSGGSAAGHDLPTWMSRSGSKSGIGPLPVAASMSRSGSKAGVGPLPVATSTLLGSRLGPSATTPAVLAELPGAAPGKVVTSNSPPTNSLESQTVAAGLRSTPTASGSCQTQPVELSSPLGSSSGTPPREKLPVLPEAVHPPLAVCSPPEPLAVRSVAPTGESLELSEDFLMQKLAEIGFADPERQPSERESTQTTLAANANKSPVGNTCDLNRAATDPTRAMSKCSSSSSLHSNGGEIYLS